MASIYDVIILGAGPAGLTAGIYLSRAKAKVLIVDEGMPGGQINLTHRVDNYPGVESANGYVLASTMKKQALQFGCEMKANTKIESLNLENDIKQIVTKKGENLEAKIIILSTGGRSRTLNISGEKEYTGRGISYCATCDGDFFQDKEIIVLGGGNSAIEEAQALTKYASKVTIVHEFDYFQAYEQAVKTAKENPKINFILESTITEFSGSEKLEKVKIKHIPSGEIQEVKIDGVFIFVGYVPNTEFIKDIVKLNEWGEIITNNRLETNLKGVFAAGDSRDTDFRQITTAVADGTRAALYALEEIFENK